MSETLRDQIAFEAECADRGSQNYYDRQDKLREAGSAESTDAASYLLRQRLEEVAESLQARAGVNIGKGAKYNRLLTAAAGPDGDFLKVAYIGLRTILNAVTGADKAIVTRVCLEIATRLETDLKCALFQAAHPGYFNTVMKSFTEQMVTDYDHMHKVLMMKFNQFELDWEPWPVEQRVHTGQRVLACVLGCFEDVFFINKEHLAGKTQYFIDTTAEFDEWAGEFERERGLLFPLLLPTKIPPADWTGHGEGGYYTPQMRAAVPLIKTKHRDHRSWVEQFPIDTHRAGLNKLQRVAWRINRWVLAVQEEVYQKGLEVGIPSSIRITPPAFPAHLRDLEKADLTEAQTEEVQEWKALAKRAYLAEKERKGKVISFMQTFRLAKELATWDRMYFVYNLDFRGRAYCATSGLSPQGSDTARGLLEFADPLPLGKSGIQWLAIHGANCYGIDKVSYADRVAWVAAEEPNIRLVAEDPVTHRAYWGAADKPYKFLAFCRAWADADFGRDEHAECRIPVGVDGSCNGLQHYSALLRDPLGAAATNLTAAPIPADVYAAVANRVTDKLRTTIHEYAIIWLTAGVNRKTTKRTVMTLVYGATQSSARLNLLEYIMENRHLFQVPDAELFALAKWLTPILWEAIGEVLVAARQCMDYLRESADGFVKWTTPVGFPVYQGYKKCKTKDVRTYLNGGIRLKITDFDEAAPANKLRQKNGVAPNFVHSLDSTHLMMTLDELALPAVYAVHDEYGTHAACVNDLQAAIRRSFERLYTEQSPLHEWADQVQANADKLPPIGSYDIREVRRSEYFFG